MRHVPIHATSRPIAAVRPTRRHRIGAALLLVAGALGVGQAPAAVFCVATGDALASALQTAASNNQDDEIHVRDGTLTRSGISGTVPRWEYKTTGSVDGTRSLLISGGWTDCSTQVQDATLTVLDAQYQGSTLHFAMDSSSGSIRVTNLTLTRGLHYGNSLGGPAFAANLGVFAPTATLTVKLDHLVVVSGEATTDDNVVGGIQVYGSGAAMTIDVSNNVIAYNSAMKWAGLFVNVEDGTVTVNNNSIFGNSASGDSMYVLGVGFALLNSTGHSYVANNVIVTNTRGNGAAADFQNLTANSYLRNNHIGVSNYNVVPSYNLNPTTGDPGWTITGIYPTPNAVSKLRDSGTNAPFGGVGTFDVAGNPRIANATVDRGAVEAAPNAPSDRIFADGFQ